MTPASAPDPTVRRVSVIAQCYNHERFVRECLDSIHQQSWTDFELIVVDDCSADASVEAIRQWIASERPDTTLLALPENLGVSGSLNAAVREARGEFVIRVSTDDVWEPTLLQELLARFGALPAHYGAVYADAIRIDEDGTRLSGDFIATYHGGVAPEGDVFLALCDTNFVPAATIMMRHSVLTAVGEFDESLAYEDWDMWLRIAERHSFGFVPKTLARYRIVQHSLFRTLFVAGGQTTAASATHCEMARRLLAMDRLDVPTRRLWERRLWENAYRLRAAKDARAAEYLALASKHARSTRARDAILRALLSLGLSRGFLSSLARGVRTVMGTRRASGAKPPTPPTAPR
jgi:glycosyltransferase involved in cell wall biosynthesis